jgi:hypothetical protein
MPYMNCPSCQLSVYAPRAAFSTLHCCPRCDTALRGAPRLFTTDVPQRLEERVKNSHGVAPAGRAPAHRS